MRKIIVPLLLTRSMKVALVLLTLTVMYLSALMYVYVSSRVYVNPSNHGVVYAAYEYESEKPPAEWYKPEQLGIVDVIEYRESGSRFIEIVVDKDKEPFPLQMEQTIFLYNDKFYIVSSRWVTSGLPEHIVNQWLFPLVGGALGAGWGFTVLPFFKWRKKERRAQPSIGSLSAS